MVSCGLIIGLAVSRRLCWKSRALGWSPQTGLSSRFPIDLDDTLDVARALRAFFDSGKYVAIPSLTTIPSAGLGLNSGNTHDILQQRAANLCILRSHYCSSTRDQIGGQANHVAFASCHFGTRAWDQHGHQRRLYIELGGLGGAGRMGDFVSAQGTRRVATLCDLCTCATQNISRNGMGTTDGIDFFFFWYSGLTGAGPGPHRAVVSIRPWRKGRSVGSSQDMHTQE